MLESRAKLASEQSEIAAKNEATDRLTAESTKRPRRIPDEAQSTSPTHETSGSATTPISDPCC
jgi:hypothetical protein